MPKEKLKVKNTSSVPCPSCDSQFSFVSDVRFSPSMDLGCCATRRRRVCLECDYKFTTYEISQQSIKKVIGNKGYVTRRKLRTFLDNVRKELV